MGLFHSSDIGLDLGTSNVLAYVRGKGIVLREPNIAAVERGTGKLVAIGQEAKELVGRAPDNLMIIRPMQDGVVANFDATDPVGPAAKGGRAAAVILEEEPEDRL